ncbi:MULTISPECIES: preprotein translocase subunit SecE [Aerococcus]|uniref:preprotein translocase subunit SecE n=1 Tax=Aerococcus TaxID=1375 RepID=UPI000200F08B|nr:MULTISPECIES: preprotein translocase subunit SecE [Aerococcus]AEA00845.1 preprotein translocase, SecE subunit [Aerococcus sp. Group 1]MCY3030676.1 preprotein translocase subunit SecE [Aerococcus sp. Group 1]MCY3036901.1 preprotein translocase subunit SecE [Aerococcus sp. Group 2]MCY3040331.1 preprotein translocase subunit SecE [Aerococcus sp. Group 2]MCY3042034.1 preprotein translocase subunit SecE [Aerococcus sp. Group 2]
MINAFKELKKVTWPSGRELRRDTAIVIVTIIIMAFFLGLTDEIVTQLFNLYIQL